MHLTLHFLGEAEIPRISGAIQQVLFSRFEVTLAGVGQFPSAGGSVTLWAGVRESASLQQLHDAVADALGATGFKKEARPYNPHITLARGEAGFSSAVVAEFLSKHASFELPWVRVSGFSLYSSVSVDGVPSYRREGTFTSPVRP